jgi:uncharacterized membrane protein YcaP (DUF421 family)
MLDVLNIDWMSIFKPSLGIAEIIVRGTLVYLALFLIFRLVVRRQSGSFGPADLLAIVIIADAAQNAMGKDYGSVTEGIVLVMTIVGWEYFLDWLAWRYPRLRPILKVPPLKLVENGKLIQKNLRSEMLGADEVIGGLREKGVRDLNEIEAAYLEASGKIAVIKAQATPEPHERTLAR